MPNPALCDFMTTTPSCCATTQLDVVWKIFTSKQCDLLVVVNEQECPLGVVHLSSLIPHLITASEGRGDLTEISLCKLSPGLVEPLMTVPAKLSVEQFGSYLQTHLSTTNTSFNWALVDPEGKFLGLVESPRLLQYLAMSQAMSTKKQRRDRPQSLELDPLAQLLDKLPWPLMLQTSDGEVAIQNSAWWQQFAVFNASEGIGPEVKALLEKGKIVIDKNQPSEVKSQKLREHQARLADSSYPFFKKPHPLRTDQDYIDLEVAPPPVDNSHFYLPSATTFNRCQLGTQPGTCICILAGQNGQERVWEFSKIPLHLPSIGNQTDNIQSWLLLATDITKEQQLASELAAKNADVIQLNRLKDEFLACISHELKTPLTAVLGLSTLLKDQAIGQLNERQARYAALIHQSGRHLMKVVNDILDLTRMETGQMELTLQPIELRKVCDRALQQVRSTQSETRLAEPEDRRFTLAIEPGLDNCVADELRLRQMLVHLLANAFKFTESGGEIGLQVSRCSGWITFTVWDTGIGIPEHQQHLIFQKFQQLENPLTRQFKGTGLGLVLTRALARLHGGDVSFVSIEGKGSQFTLLLPPCPPPKRSLEHVATFTSSRSLVLIVEAAPRFVADLTEQLTGLGYQFVIARSGTEALEKARRLQPIVVLLNPFLPLLSGWDVLTLLKSEPLTSQIPVIVTATRADREQAFLNRADDFLSLPVQQQSLQEILERFCQRQISSPSQNIAQNRQNETPLTILHLVNSHSSMPVSGVFQTRERGISLSGSPSTLNYRVLEADDLEQAELLARVWQPNVILLAADIPKPVAYVKQLCQHPSLKSLPLVTLGVATTQAANQVPGLSVFPCLTPKQNWSIDTLSSVLEVAAGSGTKPSLLVVDAEINQTLAQKRGEGKNRDNE